MDQTLLAPVDTSQKVAMPDQVGGGRYQISRLLGEGANKRVYLARDTRLDRDVALAEIKTPLLDDDGKARLKRETQAMGQLGDHAGIVTVHDILEENGQVFIVTQYMAGGDVARHLDARPERRLPAKEASALALQIAAALEHAHGSGVIHRDIKPGNVWLGADGAALLGDFGLAFAVDRTRLTQEGMMVGTASYMPPEQALGKLPDREKAADHLRCAVEGTVRLGARPYEAESRMHLARVLSSDGPQKDIEAARQQMEKALAIANELNLAPVKARVEALDLR